MISAIHLTDEKRISIWVFDHMSNLTNHKKLREISLYLSMFYLKYFCNELLFDYLIVWRSVGSRGEELFGV